jgi:hypothetical protein
LANAFWRSASASRARICSAVGGASIVRTGRPCLSRTTPPRDSGALSV